MHNKIFNRILANEKNFSHKFREKRKEKKATTKKNIVLCCVWIFSSTQTTTTKLLSKISLSFHSSNIYRQLPTKFDQDFEQYNAFNLAVFYWFFLWAAFHSFWAFFRLSFLSYLCRTTTRPKPILKMLSFFFYIDFMLSTYTHSIWRRWMAECHPFIANIFIRAIE